MSQFKDEKAEDSDCIISSYAYQYKVGNVLGEGSYGQVVKCFQLQTGIPVAIKFQNAECAKYEFSMMTRISHLDPEIYNLVQYYDYFQHGKHACLVFELLDKSLWDVMNKTSRFFLDEIRPIMHQLLVALQALQSAGIIHCDIKEDNIMFVNHQKDPFRVKLIDFGWARLASKVEAGMKCQVECLRAPEVILGLEMTEAIDMWSLGLIMASMLLGFNLYNATYEYDLLKLIIGTLGQPPADLLNNAKYTETFFAKDGDVWRFKTPEEYEASGQKINVKAGCIVKNLDELKNYYRVYNSAEYQDLCDFTDLLQKMLKVDPKERITPSEALQHNYITMEHLERACPYIQLCFRNMQVCARGWYMDSKYEYTVCDSTNTGLAKGGTDPAPVSDHSNNNTLLIDNSRTVVRSHRVSDPTRDNLMSSEGRAVLRGNCQTLLVGNPITNDLTSEGGCENTGNPQRGSVSDPSKHFLIGSDNGSIQNPSECEGLVGCDPPSSSVVVSDCCSARDGANDDARFPQCLSAETRNIAKVKPLMRITILLSRVFRVLFMHITNIQNIICNECRAIFCRNSKSSDEDIIDVMVSCDEPPASDSRSTMAESLSGPSDDDIVDVMVSCDRPPASGSRATVVESLSGPSDDDIVDVMVSCDEPPASGSRATVVESFSGPSDDDIVDVMVSCDRPPASGSRATVVESLSGPSDDDIVDVMVSCDRPPASDSRSTMAESLSGPSDDDIVDVTVKDDESPASGSRATVVESLSGPSDDDIVDVMVSCDRPPASDSHPAVVATTDFVAPDKREGRNIKLLMMIPKLIHNFFKP